MVGGERGAVYLVERWRVDADEHCAEVGEQVDGVWVEVSEVIHPPGGRPARPGAKKDAWRWQLSVLEGLLDLARQDRPCSYTFEYARPPIIGREVYLIDGGAFF